MVLGIEELVGVDRAGIYVISAPCMSSPKIYKIGKSVNLRKRLDQYQLAFPYGFLVELLWIFPRRLTNAKYELGKVERFIQNNLEMVQTTTRRARTEWYTNEKIEIVDAFLEAFKRFGHIGGQLENPSTAFTHA